MEKLRSCGVTDGCTIQVTSRLRGGGKHKEKKSKGEKKRAAKPHGPEQKSEEEPKGDKGPVLQECDREAVIRMLEENEVYRKTVEDVSGGSDVDVELKMRYWASKLLERPGGDVMECGLRWAVEARRKKRGEEKRQQEQEEQEEGRREEQEQRRQEEQEQIPGQEQDKKVRFREEEPLDETRAQSTDEQEVTGKTG